MILPTWCIGLTILRKVVSYEEDQFKPFCQACENQWPSTQNVNKNCDSFLQDNFWISVRQNHINLLSQTEI